MADKQPRIAVVVNARFLTQPTTGVQRFAIEISRHLKKLMPAIRFVAPKNILHENTAQELNVERYGNFTSHFWEQIELPVYLKQKESPLLLNLCNTAPLFYRRNLVTIHDIAFHVHPQWFSVAFVRLYQFLIPRIARRSLKIITVSNFSKEEIIRYAQVPAAKVKVIPNGIAAIFLDQNSAGAVEFKNYILAVASIDPRKNLISLVKAFKQLNHPELTLVIVGGKSKVFADATLKEEIRDCAAITFTGYVSDERLAALYKNARLFAYPSLYEGFGIPPLEAMASGCPTIVAKTAALPEICGEASLYVHPNNVADLADKIRLLHTDELLRKEMRQKGYQRVQRYSWEQSAQQVAVILRQQP